MDAKTKKIIGAEVLSRLNSESEGVLSPGSFLSAVDSVGVNEKFDYVVSRAVTDMATFVGWVWNKIARGEGKGTLPNGILYLKGGDLTEELAATKMQWQQYNISDFFEEDFFETKKVVYTKK